MFKHAGGLYIQSNPGSMTVGDPQLLPVAGVPTDPGSPIIMVLAGVSNWVSEIEAPIDPPDETELQIG
jgi:hypothetical protein